ncbi:hypothetical protein QJS04_geneDACA015252 [Acorus gramineus]|uniref:Uncharacterized protein n=1 Tax=Acorus gramineus TaxID=55184 RepID=A0AAV9AR98_ACOGR|nr:hypothetical protein QJS04_geneDACA015252 [Acorus gramineus]
MRCRDRESPPRHPHLLRRTSQQEEEDKEHNQGCHALLRLLIHWKPPQEAPQEINIHEPLEPPRDGERWKGSFDGGGRNEKTLLVSPTQMLSFSD